MSNSMAEIKEREIESLEHQEKQDNTSISMDICPQCGQRPTSYPYICFLPSPYGWIECAACGIIYSPLSLRKQKLAAAKHNIQKSQMIVTEN